MFPAWMIPMFKQIGINAAKNAVTGRNLLDGAEFAAISGGIQGAVNPASAKNVSGVGNAPSGVSGVGSMPSAGTSSVVPDSIESSGMVFNPDTGTYLDQSSYTNILGTPTYTGGEGLLSNAMGNIGDNLSGLSKYATPQNLLGVGMLLNNIEATPRMPAAAGGVRGGGAVNYQPISTATAQRRKKRG